MTEPTTTLELARTGERYTIHAVIPVPHGHTPATMLFAAASALDRTTDWVRQNIMPGEASSIVDHAVDLYHVRQGAMPPRTPPATPAEAWADFLRS